MFINNLQAQERPDKMPVYPGCEQAEQKMPCMRQKILDFIGDNFDTDLIKEIKDTKQISVYVSFIIDELGKVDEINIKSGYEKLNAELQRIIQKLPVIKPAEAGGYPIRMRYELPIVFDTGK